MVSNMVCRGRKVRLLLSGGDMGPKKVAKLINFSKLKRRSWMKTRKPAQTDKFKAAACEPGCDEDEARCNERLGAVVKQKVPEKPE